MRQVDTIDFHMHRIDIDLRRIDLNLLVTLDALLTTRSVTAAARRLGLGQPATSHALRRLRDLLGDPLLVRAGRGLEPTPRAEALAAPLARLLRDAEQLLRTETTFDQRRSRRVFRLVCPDLTLPFLPEILGAITPVAPRVRVEVRQPGTTSAAEALIAGGDDLALAPPQADVPGLIQRSLGTVRWAVFARADHPALARRHPGADPRLGLAAWLRHPHVVVRTGSSSPSLVERAIAEAGHARQVGVQVPSFLAAALVVARTELFLAAPRVLLAPLARSLGLVVLDPPIALPPVPAVALWPERLHLDPGHRWFRDLVTAVVGDVLSSANPS